MKKIFYHSLEKIEIIVSGRAFNVKPVLKNKYVDHKWMLVYILCRLGKTLIKKSMLLYSLFVFCCFCFLLFYLFFQKQEEKISRVYTRAYNTRQKRIRQKDLKKKL